MTAGLRNTRPFTRKKSASSADLLDTLSRLLPESVRVFVATRELSPRRLIGLELVRAWLPAMRAVSGDADMSFETILKIPGLGENAHSELLSLMRALTGDESAGRVAYSTEAGLFQQAGIQTLVCGPGDIRQACRAIVNR